MLDTLKRGDEEPVLLCETSALVESGLAVPFEVLYRGEVLNAFAVRFQGQVHGYLNRCVHLPMEMDFQANRFFDGSGQWLICSTHAALYDPATGVCVSGPCGGALVKIPMSEVGGKVYWHTSSAIQTVF